MTIGQRIAEERKKLGLSQEALGEKLGVSRQAISKWESDASVPEIDKLIVLSKLFNVSVGWLLGVEDSAAAEKAAPVEAILEPKTSFWQELHQGLLARGFFPWETQAGGPWYWKIFRWFTPKRLGILLLILTQLYLSLWVIRSNNMANDAQIQAMIAKSAANAAQNEVAVLKNALAAQQEATPDLLLGEYSFLFDPEPDVLKATVTFSAVPNSWQNGQTGYLCISGKGIQSMEVPCQWDGAFLRCAAVLDLSHAVQLCFAVEYADGSRQLQPLSVPELENNVYAQPPTVSGSIAGIQYIEKASAVRLDGLDVSFQRSEAYGSTAVTWQTQAILLLADGEEAARLYHFDANTHPKDSSFTSGGGGFYTREKLLPNVTLTEDQQVELVLLAELSNGLSTREVLHRWTVGANGVLEPID